MESYNVAGMMSGTSFDGLDMVLCRFNREGDKWKYTITDCTTQPYTKKWKQEIEHAPQLSALQFILIHKEYGRFLGRSIKSFLKNRPVDLIASHGHTIFHQPEKKLSFQLGDGSALAANSGITTISDFRSLDTEMGGQGAPLVPIGDELLFGDYDFCLNIGGFANVSCNKDGKRIAWDICPVNIVLNRIVRQFGVDYDEGGNSGRIGKCDFKLLERLNNLPYYSQKPPKSLGREWIEDYVIPLTDKAGLNTYDLLRTLYEHAAVQIRKCFENTKNARILATGGGVFNDFLIERIEQQDITLIKPDNIIIKYKEALVFAFLGLLRHLGEENCLSSVTGASDNSCSGGEFIIKKWVKT